MSSFKAACVQLRSGRTISDNIETTSALIREAAAAGARYVQTPEMTHLVETSRTSLKEKISLTENDAAVLAFSSLAEELKIHLHVGSLAIARADGKVANRAFFFSPEGETLATYDKIHMFDVDLENGESWRESNTYEPGLESPVVKTDFASFGLAICYDLRFPALFREQALAGANILTAPACFTQQTGRAHWHVLLRSRAIENGSYMIAAAQGGLHEDGRTTFGHSLIVDPWGEIIAESFGDEPGFITADIDLEKIEKVRGRIPVLKHVRTFDTSQT